MWKKYYHFDHGLINYKGGATMYHHTLSLDGVSVGVRSNVDLAPTFSKWKNIPYLSDVEIYQGKTHEFTIEYNDSLSKEVTYSSDTVYINVPLSNLQTGELLLYAAQPFMEVLHQRKAVVTMHAASVELNGKSILLLGKAGAGKTSLTLALCRNHSAKLVGNDIVRVGLVNGDVMAVAGSKYFFLRQESIRRNIPDLLSLFPKSKKDSWTHKIYCFPDKLGIANQYDVISIKNSYLVHVDETMDGLYTKSADNIDTRLYLNENMSRYIRGTAISLFCEEPKFMGFVPCLDTTDFFASRVRLIETIISQTKLEYLSGNLHNICQNIVTNSDSAATP